MVSNSADSIAVSFESLAVCNSLVESYNFKAVVNLCTQGEQKNNTLLTIV